jgi:Icc-related predicted phosphoesterase
MKILIFSDIHGDIGALRRLISRPANLYVSAGDLSNFGRGLERAGEILHPLGEKIWVLPGNHETEQENHDFCGRYGLTDFQRQVRTTGDFTWAGLGYSNPTPFDTPGEYSEEEIGEALAKFESQLQNEARLILVAHFPPSGTRLDQVATGKHAGSPTLRAWVERVQPSYLFCGHIHECAGESDRIGSTQCFNVGKSGYLLEIPDQTDQ